MTDLSKVFVELTQTDAQISREINKAISKEVNSIVKNRASRVERRFKSVIPTWVFETPEMQSLLQEGVPNSLSAQFGLPAGTGAGVVDQIGFAIAQSISFDVQKAPSSAAKGGVTFNFQPSSFGNLITLSAGTVRTARGQVLPWLEWLLSQGTKTIIYGYQYEPGDAGRSFGGTMIGGNIWRVPPEFAGTQNNNFLTRMFAEREKEIASILEGLFNV